MLKEMAQMSKMSDKDRLQLMHLQEGLQGSRPMDMAWIDSTIGALKTNPNVFKIMVKGKGEMLGECISMQSAESESFCQ